MIVALHYPNNFSPPVGCWWWPAGATVPSSYYVPGNESAQVSGNTKMLGVQSDVQFADYVERLRDGSPFTEAWGVIYAPDNVDPTTVLKAIRARAA